MGYSRETYDSAMYELQIRQTQAENTANENKLRFYSMFPRAREIDRELASLAANTAKAVAKGLNVRQEMTRLKEKSLLLQQERDSLLSKVGFEKDFLQPHYYCSACNDSGYIDGKMCSCLKSLLRQEAYRSLNALTPLSLCTFESFELDYYSDEINPESGISLRMRMERIFNFCKNYANDFCPKTSDSLIFQGSTGLGKTHLSLSIANSAISAGYGVIYGSVQNLVSSLENERFGKSDDTDGHTSRMLLNCDLLILDDLGTEFTTSFTSAAIYNIINTRLMSDKPTIISTNLSIRDLQSRYSERLVSRIIGGYVRLSFGGKDVRQLRRKRHIEQNIGRSF